MAAHRPSERNLNVDEILATLEESDFEDLETANSFDVYFAPPDVRDVTDEDSADEDVGGSINNLNAHQLTAQAEATLRNGTEDKVIGSYESDEHDLEIQVNTEESKRIHRRKSVLYAVQKGRTNFELSGEELKVFFGILLVSGYDVVPRKRLYWEESDDTKNCAISNAMRRRRFEDIMRNIHLNDNTNLDKNDKLSKIRPYLDYLRNCFGEYAVWERESSIDEAMIPYFGRHGLKQFIRGKPIRFGYKVWCHNFRLGYLVNFEIYQGSKGPQNNYREYYGLGGGILLQLSEILPKDSNGDFLPHHLCADNYFISLNIVNKFTEIGIGVSGTIRSNGTEDCPLKSIAEIKKECRGTFDMKFDQHSKLVVCRWNDNAVVMSVSNCESVNPITNVQRYSYSMKKKIYVTQPQIIKSYNHNMGGTDRMDQNVNYYSTNIRSKKWWWPIFLWGLDVTIQNCWLLYRQSGNQEMDLLLFRRSIARDLLQKYGKPKSKTGPNVSPVDSRVSLEVRFDERSHFIVPQMKRTRCAVCKSHTSRKCTKCNIALHDKCFQTFHLKK